MKINLDDPNLTAFALGELPATEHAKMAEAIASSPEAQSFVAETQQLSRMLKAEYEADRVSAPNVSEKRPYVRSANIIRMEEERRSWSRYQWGSLAAALAIFAVLGALAISTIQRETARMEKQIADSPKLPNRVNLPVEAEPGPSVDMYIAQQPVEPQATAAPNTAPEFVEEKQSAGRNSAAGKFGGLALNPSAPPPMARMLRKPAPGELAEAEMPSRYRQDFNTAT